MQILIYAFTTDYDHSIQESTGATDGGMGYYYPIFQDVHVMVGVLIALGLITR